MSGRQTRRFRRRHRSIITTCISIRIWPRGNEVADDTSCEGYVDYIKKDSEKVSELIEAAGIQKQ